MIDEVDWSAMVADVKGAAFEGLLEKAANDGVAFIASVQLGTDGFLE